MSGATTSFINVRIPPPVVNKKQRLLLLLGKYPNKVGSVPVAILIAILFHVTVNDAD